MAHPLMYENIWLQQQKFEDAERLYRQIQAGTATSNDKSKGSSLVGELAQVRQDIQKALNKPPVGAAAGGDNSVYQRLDALEKENKELKKVTDELRSLILNIQSSIGMKNTAAAAPAPSKPSKPAPADDDDDDDDDDFDLFGSDDEDAAAAAEALREKRLKEYAEKKAKKPAVIAKSNVVLDVKPWDDETDMKVVEANVRKIKMDGLVWGAGKLQEVGYGIKKLVISCVVEDEKVSIDDLQETICADEDNVQSVDIAAFNKV